MGVQVMAAVRAGAFDFEVFEEMDTVSHTTTVGTGEGRGILGEIEAAHHADWSRLVTVGTDAGLCQYCGFTIGTHY